ncbi:retrovirus-related pol polyprotein from transposon TNT 1-94, partial [Tanacetum coccineum]
MLNKDNYAPWSSHLLRYAKSKPNGNLIYNSIMNGSYTNEELTKKEVKQMEYDDQAIQIILMGLLEDIYVVVDSCETTEEIWLHIQQMMKGSDINIQNKKAKLFNDWERFTSTDGESIKQIAQLGMNLGQDKQMQMVGGNGENQFRYYAGQNVGNQNRYNAVQIVRNQVVQNAVQNLSILNVRNQNRLIVVLGIANQNLIPNGNGNVVAAQAEGNVIRNNGDLEKIEEVNANSENDSNVIFIVSNMEQSRGIVEQHPATIEETHALYDSLYNNLAIEVEKVNTVNCKMKETNADLTTELARYKNQEKCFEINQEKYDKLERCYQKSVYQEQCLTKKINALHLSSAKTITTLNEEIANLNNQLSKEKSTVSFLNEEKKKLKSDFKIREDELLDKQIQLEYKIKELDNILVKTGQSIQTMHMLSPKPDSFYHTEQKMALGYQNPFYLKQAQQKQQSLYNGKVLLEKHDPPDVYDSEETLQLAQESRLKMRQLNKEIKLANYAKINHLSEVFASQKAKSPKLVRDIKSLAKEADESLAKHKDLEFEIVRLLRAVVSQDIMSIVQNIAYNDMQQKFKWFQAQLGDLKGKSRDTSCESDTLDPLSQKLENESMELEFQVLNYAKENVHLKTTYKNLFDSISLFDKVSEQKDTTKGTGTNTKFANQSTKRKPSLQSLRKSFVVRQPNAFQSEHPNFSKTQIPQKVDKTNDLSNPITLNSVPTTKESKVVDNDKVIAPGMFRINPFKNSREEKFVPNKPTKAIVRTNPITVSQPHVITKKVVNSDSNSFSSITTKTRRPQPRRNTKNDRVPSASKHSRIKNKEVEVEERPRNLLISKNKKHISSECNNVKLDIWNDKSKIVCAMCKQCLITANHDVCVLNYVNGMNSRSKKQKANVLILQIKRNISHRWSPTGKMFDIKGKLITSSESNGDNACTPNPQEPTIKRFPNSTFSLGRLSKYVCGTVRFGNDHVAVILGFGDLQWGNILITRVYFVEGLGHNLFSVGQFCDSDLEVAFRRNTCFVSNLKGVDLLKGNRTTNLYTINLYDMASASPICLMARATSTKSWLCHQRLSHLNFDTINDLAKNNLVIGLPKFKYHKEHLCTSCEQGKSKMASHPPKPVPNSKSKDEAPEEIKTFLKKIIVLLQAPVIIVRTDNGTKFKNQVLQEYFNSVGISHQASSV